MLATIDLLPVVEHLRRQLGVRLRAVVLFGSRARGDARPDSDIDVLVVADGLPRDPIARLTELRRPLAGLDRQLQRRLALLEPLVFQLSLGREKCFQLFGRNLAFVDAADTSIYA